MKTHWFSQKYTVYLLEWNFPFLVLKDSRKLNTTIWLIRLHIELNNILTLRALSKDLDFLITTSLKKWKITLITWKVLPNLKIWLIEQMIHSHACAATLMETGVSLYLRSRNCYNATNTPIQTLQELFWHHWYSRWIILRAKQFGGIAN